jgi:fucose permease
MPNTTGLAKLDSGHAPEETKNSVKPAITNKKYLITFCFVVSLFMLWGISMTMGDVLNRHFQKVLHISKSRSSLVQFSMFGAYAVMAIPVGLFMRRYGYKKGVLLGLGLYAAGAFLFIPASNAASFTFFRFALFILACGLATLETVAHPFISVLGDQRSSERRLNFAQGFNGLGGVMGSFAGGYFILRAGTEHSDNLFAVKLLYGIIGLVILAVALSFYFVRVPPLAGDARSSEMARDKKSPDIPVDGTHSSGIAASNKSAGSSTSIHPDETHSSGIATGNKSTGSSTSIHPDETHSSGIATGNKSEATSINITTDAPASGPMNGSMSYPSNSSQKKLFQHKNFVWAIVANFFCVAIQGGTWAYFINYGVEKMNFSGEKAAYYFGLSMILKMAGRFIGVWWMRFIAPNVLLAIFSGGGILMCLIVAQSWGWPSYIALIMLNFFFSIMVPTIYGLGLKDLGEHRQRASSFIVLGVSGGAVFPPLMGLIANHDVATAYYLPIICYAFIFIFAVWLAKLR